MDSVQDLRSHSVDRQREVSKKTKTWTPSEPVSILTMPAGSATKFRRKASKLCVLATSGRAQGIAQETDATQSSNAAAKRDEARNVRRSSAQRKLPVLGDDDDNSTEEIHAYDSQADDTAPSSYDESLATAYEDRIHDGTAVLKAAVSRAVKKFEDVQTTKLVKEEYDELGDLSDDDTRDTKRVTDDDFELL